MGRQSAFGDTMKPVFAVLAPTIEAENVIGRMR